MKYAITEQLKQVQADLAQRFHAAVLQRMYELQRGARPSIGNALDCAITTMENWDRQAAGADGVMAAAAPKSEWNGRCVLGHCNSPSGCERDGCCRADPIFGVRVDATDQGEK